MNSPLSRAAAYLAAERQQPYTAAEHAAATGREAEYARDVPRTCICAWLFIRAHAQYTGRYERTSHNPDCPWHAQETS